jgi:tetratricopeptide (TPR) repeat protein
MMRQLWRWQAKHPIESMRQCWGLSLIGYQLYACVGFEAEALPWARKAAALADDLTDPLVRCLAYSTYADVLERLRRLPEALPQAQKAAELADELTDPAARYSAYMSCTGVLKGLGRPAEALPWSRKAAESADEWTEPEARCQAYYLLTEVLDSLGRYAEALPQAQTAAELADELAHPEICCNAYVACANALSFLRRHAEALPLAQKAAAIIEDLTDSHTRCLVHSFLANLLLQLGRFDDALPRAKKATELADHLPDSPTRCRAYYTRANVLTDLGQPAEALPWAQKAAAMADHLPDPNVRGEAYSSNASVEFGLSRFRGSLGWCHRALGELHDVLRSNRWPAGMGSIVKRSDRLFDAGMLVSERAFQESPPPDVLWDGLTFADSARAVAIREGLRRLARLPVTPPADVDWQPGPDHWTSLFRRRRGISDVGRAAIRGPRRADEPVRPSAMVLELPEETDATKQSLSQPLARDDLEHLLPDTDTVLVTFHFIEDDLYVLPVRRGTDGKLELRHTPEGYLSVPKVRPALTDLVAKHEAVFHRIHEDQLSQLPAAELRRALAALAQPAYDRFTDPWAPSASPAGQPAAPAEPEFINYDDLFRTLARLLRLDDLLRLIEPDARLRRRRHLVLLPDGPVYQLPLHAARVGRRGRPLTDAVGSVRYALSLRSLVMLNEVEREQRQRHPDRLPLRGVAFASPGGNRGYPYLASARTEVRHLVAGSPSGSWRIFGERPGADVFACRTNLRRHHPAPTLLWSIAHGGLMADEIELRGEPVTVVDPSLLLCDGPVSTTRLAAEGYDLRPVWQWFISACTLGRLEDREATRQVEGFIAALESLGCRRVTSAMWELNDSAAAAFGRGYLKALRAEVFDKPADQRGPHAFAVALKRALTAFRKVEDGRYDHEYYWAAYTLYGLG